MTRTFQAADLGKRMNEASKDLAKQGGHDGTDRRKTDRRSSDRRALIDRRSGLDRRRGPGRRRSDDRRSAEEGEMTDEQFGFIMAINEYKRVNRRPFPTWTEVLDILRALGYRKVAEPENIR